MPNFICATCGTQYAEGGQPPAACAICQDERQYVKATGQQWTTLERLRRTNRNSVKFKEPGLIGVSGWLTTGGREASMTEAKWLACVEVKALLEFVRDRSSERKRGLFAAACCRRVWHLLKDERSREAVDVAERYVDDAATDGEKLDAEMGAEAADQALAAGGRDTATSRAALSAYCVTGFGAGWDQADPGWDFAYSTASYAADAARADGTEANQLALLRCVFGNPFRPVTVSPGWDTRQVVALAQAAYEERELPGGHLDPARLAVLADALEEAGCTDQNIRDHLRGPGPHVRGCWALDLLLGKE
jgi:hypothetical protein